MQLTQKEIATFQKKILDWYEKNQRFLPWRKDREPYHILISEVMLQQTQVSRVVEKYILWMQRFPTLQSLALASVRDVLLYWSGLGYNRRALFLHQLAKEVVQNYNGEFPQEEKELLKLPGIGKYTARALLCFSFNRQISVVDTNIKKVILTQIEGTHMLSENDVESIAEQLLPYGKAYEWNQALMDYSSTVLRAVPHPRVTKQKPFSNSDRLYRGEIMRILLHEMSLSEDQLLEKVRVTKTVDQDRFDKILKSLVKDNLVQKKGNMVAIE